MGDPAKDMEIPSMKKLRWYEPETKIVWINVVIIMAINLGGLYYLFMFPYLEHTFLAIWSFSQAQMTLFGITGGVHRLWSHRSYKANVPLRILLAAFFYSSIERFSIFDWVRNHRQHHKYSDTEADPHNSHRGFWFSHIGWVMLKKSDVVRERARGIDMSDILADPVVQFFDRSIRPGENPLVALATLGEGWHNYHHVFPWDYKTAELKSIIFNPTTFWIDTFAKINWAYDLKHPTQEHIKNVVTKTGDGTHALIRESTKNHS